MQDLETYRRTIEEVHDYIDKIYGGVVEDNNYTALLAKLYQIIVKEEL